MKRVRIVSVILMIVFLLCGCSSVKEPQNISYKNQLNELKNMTNYQVLESTKNERTDKTCGEKSEFFDGERAHFIIDKESESDGEYYYSSDQDNCYVYGFYDKSSVWISKSIKYSDNYFYGYDIVERFEKLGGFVDQGEITYDKESESYKGSDLSGGYVYDRKTHKVIKVEIMLTDGKIRGLKETYTVDDDDNVYIDELSIEGVGITKVEIPVNQVSEEEVN